MNHITDTGQAGPFIQLGRDHAVQLAHATAEQLREAADYALRRGDTEIAEHLTAAAERMR